ncbi:MAG: hypothetical protein PHU63_01830 [Candidatus ainarchaeum sp.]|nr:hypothetical protein [Candidatus ainarchaeum sp.]
MAVKKKKIVDKWKTKKWYDLVSPEMFGGKVVGEIISSDEKSLLNRIVIVNLAELETEGEVNRRMLSSIRVNLRVIDVKGKGANTKYIGHSIQPSYLRTLARRGRTVIDLVSDEKTKDEKEMRIKLVAVAEGSISHLVRKNLRREMKTALGEIVKEMDFEKCISESLHGKITGKLYNRLKQITDMAKVEIKKLEVKENFE